MKGADIYDLIDVEMPTERRGDLTFVVLLSSVVSDRTKELYQCQQFINTTDSPNDIMICELCKLS